ncbi:MAG: hypothetical protein J5496_04680 [Lachnospiraceae bacterium]|nr:hypothetical protein [Lachnospiraceae bacterium]
MNRAEQFIRNVIARGELGHAYLIEAESDAPAFAAARTIARLAQCEKGTGCGQCASCRAFDSGNHPDIITLTHAKEQYGVGEVRAQLVEDILIRPYSFSRKVYLLPEAHKLNAACQNAILKTLEEPPVYGLILLSTGNRNALLPTVLSRLVALNADEEVTDETEAALREAEARWLALLGRIEYADASEMTGLADSMKKDGLSAEDALTVFEKLLRDLYLAKGRVMEGLSYPSEEKKTRERAEALTDGQLARLWTGLDEAKKRLKSNVNASVVLEILCLTFRQIMIDSKEK